MVVDNLRHFASGYLFTLALKLCYACMSFSVRWYRGNVQSCRTQMTLLRHMGEEVLAGSSFPQRLPQAREVRCFSTVCVGDDEAPLPTGSLYVFKLLLLCPLVFEAFLQSDYTPQTQIPQVFGSS